MTRKKQRNKDRKGKEFKKESKEYVYIYCDVPGSPCLSKNKANLAYFYGTKGSRAPCLVAARAVRWRCWHATIYSKSQAWNSKSDPN